MVRLMMAALAAVVLVTGLWGCRSGAPAQSAPAANNTGKGSPPATSTQAGMAPGSNLQFGSKLGQH